jgi:hypothetical protein
MAMLVVMITTLTTGHEALKQYDTLKAQADEWATLRLWTGFLSAYTPQDETLEAQSATCSALPAPVEHERNAALTPRLSIEIQYDVNQNRGASNHVARVEILNHEDGRPEDSVDVDERAVDERASESMEEVAFLAGQDDTRTEETSECVDESTVTASLSDDELEGASTIDALREVRLISRTVNRELAETAPLAAEAAQRSRAASRAEAQAKVKAMRRAVRVIQIRLERASRPELRTKSIDSMIELPGRADAPLPSASSTASHATDSTAVRQAADNRLQDPASISGACHGE